MTQPAAPAVEEQSLPPLETPDEQVIHCNSLLMPIVSMTVSEFEKRGYPGWAEFWASVFNTVNDVMAPEQPEEKK